MENPTNRMDAEIKKALKNHQMPYNSADWELMEQMLDDNRKPVAFWVNPNVVKILAAAVLLVSVLYGFKEIASQQSWFESPVEISQHQEEASGTDKVATITETVGESKLPFSNENEPINATSNDTKTTANQNTESGGTTIPTISNNVGDELMDKKPLTIAHSHITITEANVINNYSVIKNNQFTNVKNSDEIVRKENVITADNFSSIAQSSEVVRTSTNLIAALPVLAANEVAFTANKPQAEVEEKITSVPLELELEVLPDIPRQKPASMLRVSTVTSADANFTDFTAGPSAGYSSGVQFDRKINDHWSIETGVLYAHKEYETMEQNLLQNQGANLESSLAEPAFQDYSPQGLTAVLELIEVPVQVKYHLKPDKKFQPYVSAGLATYIPVKEQYTYTTIYNNLQDNFTEGVAPPGDAEDMPIINTPADTIPAPIIEPAGLPEPVEIVVANGYSAQTVEEEKYEVRSLERPTNPYWGIARMNTGFTYRFGKIFNLQVEAQLRASIPKYKFDRSFDESLPFSADNNSAAQYNRKRLYTVGLQAGLAIDL